ncbi:hypothetical protein BDV38DRAFT_286650 [Aspergillus pseudotamarii]|uniref:Major facilitator superfamily domain-containing protein n=1 Tax=Aspergillus pseudotamarii TaxID=132259 RepID=A0A5N6SI89_ASPPS|nr:uncharacterized protein BDV38DRAFT_286650 [Aspergillus pseudotamarii]KAE8133609.1 hypothetical protein BDV38DRAFT_286650 [Aspergillus pseudotamarii]
MQKLPPAWYLCFNIFMLGALLMCQAVSKNFASLRASSTEQLSRIAAYYLWNGIGVTGGGLIGYGTGNIKGALESWRYIFLIVGAACSSWDLLLALVLPNSPTTFWGFTCEERLMIIEAYLDYKTWLFFLLGVVGNIPNGGISNPLTLVIEGLGFGTFHTALLGIPQGVIVVIWIVLGAIIDNYLPRNSRTVVSALFMLPTIAGSLRFLLDAIRFRGSDHQSKARVATVKPMQGHI